MKFKSERGDFSKSSVEETRNRGIKKKKKKNRGVCVSVFKCTYNEPSESIFSQELFLFVSLRKGRS